MIQPVNAVPLPDPSLGVVHEFLGCIIKRSINSGYCFDSNRLQRCVSREGSNALIVSIIPSGLTGTGTMAGAAPIRSARQTFKARPCVSIGWRSKRTKERRKFRIYGDSYVRQFVNEEVNSFHVIRKLTRIFY
jgi:hypothetical protein